MQHQARRLNADRDSDVVRGTVHPASIRFATVRRRIRGDGISSSQAERFRESTNFREWWAVASWPDRVVNAIAAVALVALVGGFVSLAVVTLLGAERKSSEVTVTGVVMGAGFFFLLALFLFMSVTDWIARSRR